MLRTASIDQIAVDNPRVYAFRIRREIGAEDLKLMGATMNEAFDRHDRVSMLLIFDAFDGVELGAGLDWQTLSAQLRSLAKVDKYAVVGAPPAAATMITVADKIIPTDARSFARSDEAAAWDFVQARPLPGGT